MQKLSNKLLTIILLMYAISCNSEQLTSTDDYYLLPYEPNVDVLCLQGFDAKFSHSTQPNLYGIDFSMPEGMPILASRGGTVFRKTESNDVGGSANSLYIDHGDGTATAYLHMSLNGVYVEIDDIVERGDVIAGVGNTGKSTSPHLHFSVQFRDRVRTSNAETILFGFADVAENGGVLIGGKYYRSMNY